MYSVSRRVHGSEDHTQWPEAFFEPPSSPDVMGSKADQQFGEAPQSPLAAYFEPARCGLLRSTTALAPPLSAAAPGACKDVPHAAGSQWRRGGGEHL
eukprot:NODE_5148_length_609_cov_152.925993.p3 GENE.NODE_5148_length_609_cov_152.925993~~NODE_5148_length_609_cov_152.925993.p3  ORF type:complete len:97 (-),score=18.20 NODE_5148_length_609_cov_152.925993:309-599(-)